MWSQKKWPLEKAFLTKEEVVGLGKDSKKCYTFEDKTQSLSQWSKELGLPWNLLNKRINERGWTIEQAFTTPSKKEKFIANLVAGGMDGFNASIYGLPHPSTLNFIQQQIHQATDTLTVAGQQFAARALELYERFNGSHALRIMRAAARTASHFWQSNTIRYLAEIGDLQQAPQVMHRWLMAEPTVRQMYHDNRCDGYSHSYVDLEPGLIGNDHYDYRRVMNGVVEFNEHNDGWYARTWGEELLPDDSELAMEEKSEILDSWWAIRRLMEAKGEDPTSLYNAELE